MKCSLPHYVNERQWSVNDCWPSIMVDYSVMWPLTLIYMVLTVLVPYKAHKYLVLAVWMNWVVTIPEDVAGIFCTYLPIMVAISLFMDVCDQKPLFLQKMQDPKSLMLRWGSFSIWGRERFACFFCTKGGQYIVYECILPVSPPDYPRYTTNNRTRSIYAHCQDVVGWECLFVLITKAANTSKLDCHVGMSIFYDQQ